MQKIVECVPNFSEGRDTAKIDLIADAIRAIEGVSLLDVDPGKDTNRTVMTFVGPPEQIVEAAFAAIAKAADLIDMRRHSGAHARIGATDVCPFVPVDGVTMEECVDLAKKLGERVGRELGIPVYLYEEAATQPGRKNLADIRSGEYEGLTEKLAIPEWKPDFGPTAFNAKFGATVIGAREFLIAYNVNLNTRDVKIAKEIAFAIRETGRLQRDENGQVVRDGEGNALRAPGKFQACKAVGWYMADFGRAQISINLVNYKITPPHIVFDECCRLAEKLGARVTGSELVGLIPRQAMINAGRHYLKKQGKTTGVPESELIHIAVLSMGLNDLYPFEAEKKIIEYRIASPSKLAKMKLDDLIDLLSTDSPTPGGGSVAALCGSLSSALSAMVAALTFGKKEYLDSNPEMDELGQKAQALKDQFLADVDRDAEAFDKVTAAWRLPKKTDEEITRQKAALQEATKEATTVPFDVLQKSREAIELAVQTIEKGNVNSISDAGVAALTARAAAEGAYMNILINLKEIADREFKSDLLSRSQKLRDEVIALAQLAVDKVNARLNPL
jgi:glutamate formiminotransferase/formiminotetrahydrofolate cyclodeaminase